MRTPRDAGAARSGQRVQKILAQAGVASRRRSEDLIREGRVTVNGRVASLGTKADPDQDAIKVDGRRLKTKQAACYLLLNKPRGYLCTVSDPERRPTVMDLIPAKLLRGLHPVGRLDYNTEGLLLLTNDGDFSQRVSHPRYGCQKTYLVKVKGLPDERTLQRLRDGVTLEGRKTAPCEIVARAPSARKRSVGSRGSAVTNSWWTVRLSEGRTRQIRAMFLRGGHPVQRLRRMAIGPLSDRGLALGTYRPLRESEVEALLKATEPSSGRASKRPRSRRPGSRDRRREGRDRS